MTDLHTCPECQTVFTEDHEELKVVVRSLVYDSTDELIKAVSLLFCPYCHEVVIAVFDSLEVL